MTYEEMIRPLDFLTFRPDALGEDEKDLDSDDIFEAVEFFEATKENREAMESTTVDISGHVARFFQKANMASMHFFVDLVLLWWCN